MEEPKKNTLMKDGKKPISQKRKAMDLLADTILADDVFSSALSLDPEISRELEDKGLVPRFVDAKKLSEMGGYNDKGWQVYRRDKKPSDTINPSDFKFGNDPSGIIRRGSLVLAVKTKANADKHRKFLDQRALQQEQSNKRRGEELKAFARNSGIDAVIHEGYEENEAPGI
jgi:hypothetical protein